MQRIRKVKSMLAVALALLMLWTSGVDAAFIVLAESIPDAEVTTPAPKPVEKPQPVEKSAEVKAPEDSSETPEPSKEPDEKKESASDGETPEPSASVETPEPEVKAEDPENMEAPAGTPSPEHEVGSEETDAKTAPATQFTSGYAGVKKQTSVYSGRGTSFDPVGTVTTSNAVVYVTDRFGSGDSENDWLQIAFYVKGEDAVSTGYIRAGRATPLTEEQSAAYVKKYADSEDAVLLHNRKDIPLGAIGFEPAESGESTASEEMDDPGTAASPESSLQEQTEVQEKDGQAAGSETETGHSEIIGYAVVSTDGGELNVRAEAGTDSEILTRLANGDRVAVLGVEGDWTRVDVNGVLGYAASRYLTMEDDPTELPAMSVLMADMSLLEDEEPETTTVFARADWVYDEEDADVATRLRGTVYIRLYQNGVSFDTATLSSSNNWQAQWTDLPVADENGEPYVYTVSKYSGNFSPAYTSEVAQAEDGTWVDTETFHKAMTIEAKIQWSDNNDLFGMRPELDKDRLTITYNAYTTPIAASSLTKNEDGSYAAVFEGVPTYYRNGSNYYISSSAFNIEYEDVPLNYTKSTSMNSTTRFHTVTYTLPTWNVNLTLYTYSYLGSSFTSAEAWLKAEELGIPVPDQVTATLMKGGEAFDAVLGGPVVTQTRNENGSWTTLSYTWRNLQRDDQGQVIDYSDVSLAIDPDINEGGLSGHYTQTVTKSTGSNYVTYVVTTAIPAIRSVTVPVIWNDDNNVNSIRPSSGKLTLLANGTPVPGADVMTLRNTNGTTSAPASWSFLPKMDENGAPIHYTVQVDGLPAYYEAEFTSMPFDPETGYGTGTSISVSESLTLTLKSQKVTADVEWVSDGSETELSNRPSSVNLTLYYTADDGETWAPFWGNAAVTVARNAEGLYHYEWNLPDVDAEGNPISFKVVQNPLNIYTTTYAEPQTTVGEDGKRTTALTVTNTYNDAWNYYVDLSWDVTDPTQRYDQEHVTTSAADIILKYQMTINANKDYDVGEFEVRVPRALWADRNGKGVVPTTGQISLPMAPQTNPAFSFNYYIDDHGTPNDTSDDEIVFVNWKALETGFKQQLTVGYTITPKNTIDCSEAIVQATVTAKHTAQAQPEEQESAPIHYRLDTGVNFSSLSKSFPSSITGGRLYAWNTMFGPQPADFDPTTYNYVGYEVYVYVTGNQPFIVEIDEKPDSDGRVVAIVPYFSSSNKVTYDEESGTWKTNPTTYFGYEYYRVVVAYPRVAKEDPLKPGQTTYEDYYTNNVTVSVTAADEHPGDKGPDDQNDEFEKSAAISGPWIDYVFIYSGEVYSGSKYMYGSPGGSLTVLSYGKDVKTSMYFSMTVNGYNLSNGYSFEMLDDGVYARASIGGSATPYARLGQDDFAFASSVSVTLSSSDIDRTNGSTIPGLVPAEPFTLWGRSGEGPWERIMDITMTQSASKSYSVPAALIDGKGFTDLRLTSPEGLSGQFYAVVYASINSRALRRLSRSG